MEYRCNRVCRKSAIFWLSSSLLLLLAGCGGGGGDSPAPTPMARTVTARAFRDSAEEYYLSDNVLITWLPRADIPANEILEYQIIRDGENIATVEASATQFVDNPLIREVTYNLPIADGSDIKSFTKAASSLEYGKKHYYQINILRARQSSEQPKYQITSQGPMAGPATPLLAPTGGAVTQSAASKIRMNIAKTVGANQYIVEFSKTQDFAKKVVRGPFVFPVGGGNDFDFDLSAEYGGEPAFTRIFFRVGARNSADNPGPMNNAATPNGGDYVYSEPPQDFAINVPKPPAPP